jgi:folate-binding protein YgfZ
MPEATIELDAQYRQLREECGVVDRSGRGKVRVTGPEAAEYLQGQLTNDVEGLAPGEGCYAALLDRKGHMQADLRVLRPAEEELWLDCEAGGAEALRRHLAMYKVGRDVEVLDAGGDWAILSLVGPASAGVASAPPLPEDSCERGSVAGVECLLAGTRWGIDLIAPRAEAARLRTVLLEAGAAEVTEEALEILRIESGIPRFGAEMTSGTMPAEAGIVERAVSFTKGCYIGQETVARLHYKGRPNRLLRGLRLGAPAPSGAALALGEREVGTLGSACVSPRLGPIGLAILRREAEPGVELAVGEDGVTAQVVDLPFG